MSEDAEEATGVPRFLDDVQRVDRKRMRLDSVGRKRWSLTDKQSDQEVLQEMGVGILDPDEVEGPDVASCSHSGLAKSEVKRKRDLENVSPNVSWSPRALARPSPRRRPRSLAGSPAARSPGARSPGSAEKTEHPGRVGCELAGLERSVHEPSDPMDEETPLPLLPATGLPRLVGGAGACHASPGVCSSVGSGDWPASGGSGRRVPSSCSGVPSPYTQEEERLHEGAVGQRRHGEGGDEDAFSAVSDEVMLTVFKWLPKRSLVTCTLVCRKWHRIASDESLWTRLELGGRVLARGAVGKILAKKPVVVRLASAEVGEWHNPLEQGPSKVQYLDLSMCVVDKRTLNALLRCCPALRKLSLETVDVDEETCRLIGECERLETLNLTMSNNICPNGILSIVEGCTGLQSLNVSWCKLTATSLQLLCARAPPRLQRLNLAGSRLLTDNMVEKLAGRCPRLLELDLSDSTRLTEAAVRAVASLDRLEHLALSRCYLLTPHSLMQVSGMPSLQYLEVWGMLQAAALATLRSALPAVSINQFMHSAIARPTVGLRRTSIWGLRTRD